MAKMTMKMPEDFLIKVSRLNNKTDEILPRVLVAGGEVILNIAKNNLISVIGKNTKQPSRSTGQLVSAIGLSPVLQDKNGYHNIKVGFSEPRHDGESNAKIANIIEYGKSGQPAKPFLKPAKIKGKNSCINAMKEKLESELSNI